MSPQRVQFAFINTRPQGACPCCTDPLRPGKMKGHGSRSSSSPCAACKFLKRRCMPSCIFAPYFKAEDPQKFANVHKVFGASNVSKLLGEVPLELREDTVTTLAYEAEARLRDPVYGCVADISLLQWKMVKLQEDLANARVRLARYVNPPCLPSTSSVSLTSSPSSSYGQFFYDEADFGAHMVFSGSSEMVGGPSSFFEPTEFLQQ
ncbi:LOB domain-containing protein 21-like [Aristolochia californica]|uniref:LOB domain-containing protein 21-like n=1 Tax=Aristolochia californica TaxID=171875 RepID=UPI0035D544CB